MKTEFLDPTRTCAASTTESTTVPTTEMTTATTIKRNLLLFLMQIAKEYLFL